MRRGFTLVDFITFLACIAFVIILLIPIRSYARKLGQIQRCSANLHQLSKALQIYHYDYGKRKAYPKKDGGAFLTSLYGAKIIDFKTGKKIFVCPSTKDKIPNDLELLSNKQNDPNNVTSYAGRKNSGQEYPAMPHLFINDMSITSVASDDWQNTSNHEHGTMIQILFSDGSIRSVENPQAKENDYAAFAQGDGDYGLADPLTN